MLSVTKLVPLATNEVNYRMPSVRLRTGWQWALHHDGLCAEGASLSLKAPINFICL